MSSANRKTPDYVGAIVNLLRRKKPASKFNKEAQKTSHEPVVRDDNTYVPIIRRPDHGQMAAQTIHGDGGRNHNKWAGPEHYQDNRGLVPPEPMARALILLSEIPIGHVAVVRNDRVPGFLLAQLELDNMPYVMETNSDGSTMVQILKVRAYDFVP